MKLTFTLLIVFSICLTLVSCTSSGNKMEEYSLKLPAEWEDERYDEICYKAYRGNNENYDAALMILTMGKNEMSETLAIAEGTNLKNKTIPELIDISDINSHDIVEAFHPLFVEDMYYAVSYEDELKVSGNEAIKVELASDLDTDADIVYIVISDTAIHIIMYYSKGYYDLSEQKFICEYVDEFEEIVQSFKTK